MNILVALVLNALALLATTYVVPGFHVDNFMTALIAGIVLGLINAFIRPILAFVSAPITVLTLGLFSFVINAVVLYLASLVVPGFKLDSIMAAILGGVVLAVVSTIIASLAKEVKKALYKIFTPGVWYLTPGIGSFTLVLNPPESLISYSDVDTWSF